MVRYMAIKGGTGMFLSKSEQMDTALNNDFDIYRIDDDDKRTLIATPQDGFLVERPVIENVGVAPIG